MIIDQNISEDFFLTNNIPAKEKIMIGDQTNQPLSNENKPKYICFGFLKLKDSPMYPLCIHSPVKYFQ
jgi:hypothetical protein